MIETLRTTMMGLGGGSPSRQAFFRARIPFAFVAAAQVLEAGDYTVEPHAIPGLLVLKSAQGKESVVVRGLPDYRSPPGGAPGHSKLVFHRYGDRVFLAEVWPPASPPGRQIPPCNLELVAARQA